MKLRTLRLLVLMVAALIAQWLNNDGLAIAAPPAVPYDPANYTVLANPNAPDIPVGTEITAQNWERYRQYMPLGVQALWARKFPYHFDPSNPDYHMVIGPTIPVRLPRHVISDTEKYAGQTKLKRLSSGGYGVEGYMAGVPFPDPKEPELPYKITYNVFYRFYPLIFYSYTMLDAVDSYGNETYSKVTPIYYKLMHLSDDRTPFVNAPYANGFLIGAHEEVTAPEQSRYTNIVNLTPDDPVAEPEIYIFLPTLRRSLRLSSAARCAPSLGTDFINDDSEGFLNSPGMFKAELLGEKRILSLQHMDAKTWTDLASFKVNGPVPRWPRPVAGNWELRDAYVIAYTPVPALGRFCYGVRVAFLDKKDWMPLAFDVYDANRNLWKLFLQSTRPLKLDNG